MERIRELMGLLNPMERDIIARRFGLGIDDDQTLDEVGNATIYRASGFVRYRFKV